jgi:hypothetical protein
MVLACGGVKEPQKGDFGCEMPGFGIYSVSETIGCNYRIR